jgi:hypothetical protein
MKFIPCNRCKTADDCRARKNCTKFPRPVRSTPAALDPRNPKDIVGQLKPPMHLVPPAALIEEARVMGNGAFKYGPYNWRDKDVSHSTYLAAAYRHMGAHWDGQDFDPGAKELHKGQPQPHQLVRNLAAARASLGILIDAILTGHAIDDRPKDGVAGNLLYAEPPKAAG